MKNRHLAVIAVIALFIAAVPLSSFAQDAAAAFKTRCAPCHGADGSGNTPMGKKVGAKALGSPEVQKQSDADLLKVISGGKGKMPPFTGKLTPEQINDMVKVVRGFAAK